MSMGRKRDDGWAAEWVAKKLAEHEEVERATPRSGGLVAVDRRTLPNVVVGCVSVERFEADTVEEFAAEDPTLQFIVNAKADALFIGEALDAADENGITVGGMGDLMRALRDEPDLADYVNPDTMFIEQGLVQHRCIQHVERLARGCYRLKTHSGDQIEISVGHQYEMTAEDVRQAIDKHGPVDAVVTANPNAQPISPTAIAAGSSAGVEVLRWKEFYGRLNERWT